MVWVSILVLSLFVMLISGVSSQPVVTQEPSKSVTPGGTVSLSCSLSTGAITTGNYPGWFQQKPGSAPRLLIYQTNNRVSGIPTRFSGSISSNNAVLTITDVQAEDEFSSNFSASSGMSPPPAPSLSDSTGLWPRPCLFHHPYSLDV
uniref:Ig-like domain-containing protein n=1 Tax=Gopherus evgoodei TaxID=1825980 RepID=A0A8C4WIL5_9SAUR